jgi:hypothetical protein
MKREQLSTGYFPQPGMINYFIQRTPKKWASQGSPTRLEAQRAELQASNHILREALVLISQTKKNFAHEIATKRRLTIFIGI